MDPHRRAFLQSLGATACAGVSVAAASTPGRIAEAVRTLGTKSPEEAARDEPFWAVVREAYGLGDAPINFMSGWYGALPLVVQDAVADCWRKTNEPEYHAHTNPSWWDDRKQRSRELLAQHVNCSVDEVALTRNTTEAINTVIFGLDLKPGDELLTTSHDFLPYRCAMRQRAARDGIVVREIDPPPIPGKDPGELVDAIAQAITPRTRAVMVCHVYSGGPVAPIRAICDVAHERGVRVIVDAALGFGHVVTDLKAMDCDYYGASFHKFAGGPRGTGFLFVKKELVPALWPSYGSRNWTTQRSNHAGPQIAKLVAHGTDTTYLFAAIPAMLDIQEAIGPARRQARLFHLTRSWTDRVKDLAGVSFTVRLDPENVCGLVGMTPGKVRPRDLTRHLLKGRELLLPYPDPEFNWVNTAVFTTPEELDRLVAMLQTIIREGLSS